MFSSIAFILPALCPCFIDIILILAPGAAKYGIGPAAEEHLLAVLAQPQGFRIVHKHEAEHHLDAQQQRMEVPIDGRFLQQFNMISRRNAAEGSHGLAVKIPCILVNAVVVVVVQNGCGQRERPILELLRYPVIRLSICLLYTSDAADE